MTGASDRLTAALVTFLEEALATCGSDVAEIGSPAPGLGTFARQLAALPPAQRAGTAAFNAARDNRYLLRKALDPGGPPRAGRQLSGRALTETGTAGLLSSGRSTSLPELAVEIDAHLAGQPIPLWNYAIIDAEMELNAPVLVLDDWVLVTPDRDELASLAGVPSAASYIPERRAGAKRAVVEYIAWYNGTRLHSALGHQSQPTTKTTITRTSGE